MAVIPGNFGSRKEPVPSIALHTNGLDMAVLFFGYDEERAKRDAAFISEHPQLITATSLQIEKMRGVLLRRSPAPHEMAAIEAKRERHMHITMQVLCDTLMLSAPYQWVVMTSHYSALMLEFIGRLHQAVTLSAHRGA